MDANPDAAPPAPEADYLHLPWKTTSWPGVRLHFIESWADGGARVLIAMDPGVGYPPHRHLGEEEVFVVRGSYADAAGEYGAGSFQRNPKGSAHHPVAGPLGALLLAWAEAGIEILAEPPASR
jgi:anti-sigma factor ChrR (cupin superfamily)